ncbi:MAG: glycosyltransferase family 39 protein [Candidatus Korobacteraceae bacterium]
MKALLKEMPQQAELPDIRQEPESPASFWSLVVAAILALFYLATSIYISSHRLFWYDEIVTHNIATLHDYRTIWSAVTHGVDGGSPVYDVVARLAYQLFGTRDIAARLPSVFAMVAGMLIVFDCARRLTNALHGLIAFAVLTCSFLPYYGHEARAYAIFFMLAAMALWVWVNTREESKPAAALFGAVLFLAVAMHYYAILCLVPYGVWEIYRWRPWQRPSAKFIAGVVGAVAGLVLLLPAIFSFMHLAVAYNPWSPTSFDRMRELLAVFFPDGLWLLALIAIWIALAKPKDKTIALEPMAGGEIVGWLFLCIPLAGFIAAELKTNSFSGRYFIGTLPGVAVAFSCVIWRHFRQAQRVSIGVLAILLTYGVAKQAAETRHPDHGFYSPVRQMLSVEDSSRKDGKQFFALCNQSRYWEAYHSSKHPEQYTFLASMDSGDLRLTDNFSRYVPVQVWTMDDLKNHARETALILPHQRLLNYLKQAGFQVEVRSSSPVLVVYLK